MKTAAFAGIATAVAISLGGCGAPPKEAVADVATFLRALQGQEPMALEARIDRLSLRADLKGQLLRLPEVRALEQQLGGSVGEATIDRMLSPEAFKALGVRNGLLPQPGDLGAIRSRLKVLAAGRICLRGPDRRDCLFTFARQDRAWKLVGVRAPEVTSPALQAS